MSNAGFVEPDEIIAETRDLRGVSEAILYTVQAGDSFSVIADRFHVSIDSILWANNFAKNKILRPNQIIKIPPVSGLMHTVKKGDTLASIAKKYKIEVEKITEQNGLTGATLQEGVDLVIPGAIRPEPPKPKPTYTAPKQSSNSSSKYYAFASKSTSRIVNDGNYAYQLVKQSEGRRFAWGNCTYFVAKYKNVTWRGNAKDWLPNAKKQGLSTGSNPAIGSIIVFHGRGYNPYYGHVGIVVDLDGSDVIVKDMNYRRINEVTTRRVNRNDGAISGYIYVD